MTVHMNGSPADLGVKVKLRLQSHDQNVNDIPYKPAIEELRSISSQVTLLGKLESLGTNFEFIQWIWKKFHQGGVQGMFKSAGGEEPGTPTPIHVFLAEQNFSIHVIPA